MQRKSALDAQLVEVQRNKRKRSDNQDVLLVPDEDRPAQRQRVDDTTGLSAHESLRVAFAGARSQVVAQKKQAEKDEDKKEPEPEMDALINARTRAHKCFRAPITAFYENDRIRGSYFPFMGAALTSIAGQDPDECLEGGCPRCTLPPPLVCCELCWYRRPLARANPFSMLPDSNQPPPQSTPKPRASRVPRLKDLSQTAHDLRVELHQFRRKKTIEAFEIGRAHV